MNKCDPYASVVLAEPDPPTLLFAPFTAAVRNHSSLRCPVDCRYEPGVINSQGEPIAGSDYRYVASDMAEREAERMRLRVIAEFHRRQVDSEAAAWWRRNWR